MLFLLVGVTQKTSIQYYTRYTQTKTITYIVHTATQKTKNIKLATYIVDKSKCQVTPDQVGKMWSS